MEQPSVIYPPNRPLERILRPSQFPILYDYLLFLDVNEKEEVLVGSTNLSDCYWESTLLQYNNLKDAANLERYSGYFITSSSADAKYLPTTKLIVLAEDGGCLKVLNTPVNDDSLKCEEIYNCHHPIKQLAVWNSSRKLIACGKNSISILDVESNFCLGFLQMFKDFHMDTVTSVDTNKWNNNIFTSASQDRKVCIWDDRLEMPASILYENEFCNIKSVSWNASDIFYISVGTASGDLYQLDTRQPNQPVNTFHCFDRSIHRTQYSTKGDVAVIGNDSKVLVLNSHYKLIYENKEHTGFVRGLSWGQDCLLTCGFDKQIVKHVF